MLTITEPAHSGRGAGIEVREMEPPDAEDCARIVYEGFRRIHDRHRFERDFPTLEAAEQLVSAFIRHPSIWAVVRERGPGRRL